MNKLPEKFSLRDDFPYPTYEEWKAVVEKDLKGVPFEKKLITKTYEGIDLQPIYNLPDIEALPFIDELPGFRNHLRGNNAAGYISGDWKLTQKIHQNYPDEFNAALKNGIENGLNAIYLHCCLKIEKSSDFEIMFRDIDLTKYPIYFSPQYSGLAYLSLFAAYLKSAGYNLSDIKGGLSIDPINRLAAKGELPLPLDYLYNEMAEVIKWTDKNMPQMKVIAVDSSVYQRAGASSVQELAYSLSTAVEYFNQMTDIIPEPDLLAEKFRFTFGTGSFYFMEVAKLRAARILWSKILPEYGVKDDEITMMDIEAASTTYNQTEFDPYVNILRNTTEAFSAIVGGADSIRTNPFDESFRAPDDFSERIARNTQSILRDESNLNKYIDPAGGSYYIEKLTSMIAEKVWDEFTAIQSKGGIIACLTDGSLQDAIEKVHQERLKDFNKRKNILVGINMYANMQEELLPERKAKETDRTAELEKFRNSRDNAKLKDALIKLPKGTNIDAAVECAALGALRNEINEVSANIHLLPSLKITSVKKHRLSESYEEMRKKIYAIKPTPKIFLCTMGDVRQHKARADFARGFFETAGFDVIYDRPFSTPEEASEEALKSGAIAAVICSTDETYPELVPAIAKHLKGKIMLILAGYPKEQIEAHKANGIEQFIYVGADAFGILNNIVELALKGGK